MSIPKKVKIGPVDFVVSSEGDQVRVVVSEQGLASIPISMTKAQAATLGDLLQALAR